MSREEYYYNVENYFNSLSVLDNTGEDLDKFQINSEHNKKDPFLQALQARYISHDDDKFLAIMDDIINERIYFLDWESMETSIKAFAYAQLSFYWSVGIKTDMKKSNEYEDLAIKFKHREMLYNKAELMFCDNDINNLFKIVNMIDESIKLKKYDAFDLLIECYNTLAGLYLEQKDFENYTKHCVAVFQSYNEYLRCPVDTPVILNRMAKEFMRFKENCSDEKAFDAVKQSFLFTLIEINHKMADALLVSCSYLVDQYVVDTLLHRIKQSENVRLLDKLFFIFSGNRILFIKYMTNLANLMSDEKDKLYNQG